MSDQIQLPDLETLFGGQVSFCKCEECGSLYSPAAYLVDVLHTILETRINALDANGNPVKDQNGNPVNGTTILQQRRPDIENIELTCQNTNTPLPYVDLVNEILENAIAPIADWSQPLSDIDRAKLRTHGTPEELAANPEHVNDKAYDAKSLKTPAGAVYPWDLPFDLAAEESRVCLGQLGVTRSQLMTAFRKRLEPLDKTTTAVLKDPGIAAESLQLTTLEQRIVTGQALNPPRDPWAFWGYPDALIPQPQNDSWVNDKDAGLVKVSVFLGKSGLRFEELADLLACRFINPDGTITIEDAKATCEIESMTIQNLAPVALDKIHRFVRLRKKLGWTALELDQAISTFAPNNPDLTDVLIRLSHLQGLRANLSVPLVQMLSWWSNMDTRGDGKGGRSLYEQTFLNNAVIKPSDSDWAVYKGVLSKTPDDPNVEAITAHSPTVLAALGITTADLSLLLKGSPSLLLGSEVQDKLNLVNLSHLYRIISFARALRLSITDFLLVKALTGIDPFDAQHTEATVQFVREAGKMRASGFSLPELNYLLRHVFSPSGGIAPSGSTIALMLGEIHDGLKKIAYDNQAVADPNGDLTKKKLAVIMPPDQIEDAFAIVAGSSGKAVADQKTFVEKNFSFLDSAEVVDFELKLIWDPNRKDSQNQPSPGPDIGDPPGRFGYALRLLADYIRRTQSRSFVLEKLASGLKLDAATTAKLLTGGEPQTGAIRAASDVSKPAIVDFLPEDEVGFTNWSDGLDRFSKEPEKFLADPKTFIQNAGHPEKFAQLLDQLLLYKTALILSRFRVTSEELPWVLTDGVEKNWPGWLDPNAFPLGPANTAPLYPAWARLADFISVRDQLPPGTLLALIKVTHDGKATTQDVINILNDRLGWRLEDFQFLSGPQVLNLQFPTDYRDERALLLLKSGFDLVRRLGVPAQKISEWSGADITSDNANDIKNTLKAKYDADQWLIVAKTFQDVLRERRRAALVSFLVGNPNVVHGQTFRNSNELFDYFLIDVEMSPCQMTSRIKQAISSVQIFVQRCLMKLEWYPFKDAKGVTVSIDREAVESWHWMKNYRVWEANRKVFLYPENWLETGLLPDKTPFFKDLENKLLQADITADSAEDAFRDYLQKLDQVARLEIVGLFHEPPTENVDPDLLHVFGRTGGVAPIYYYRRRFTIGGSVNWTPWEKVDVDIQGDHLIPVVWNRRLHIFWPLFTTKTPEQKGGDTPPDKIQPKHLEIQIAWSEYRNGKWSPKNLSSGHLISNPGDLREDQVLDEGQYLFKAAVEKDTGDLIVRSIYRDAEPRGVIYYAIDDNDKFTSIPIFSGNVRGVHVAAFRFVGCEGEPLLQRIRLANHKNLDPFQEVFTTVRAANQSENDLEFLPDPLLLPTGTNTENMMVVESKATRLSIPAGTSMDDQQEETVLGASPGPFRLLYPQDEIDQFYSQDPFFYQDDDKTFFVEPEKEPVKDKWHDGNKASPDWLLQEIVH